MFKILKIKLEVLSFFIFFAAFSVSPATADSPPAVSSIGFVEPWGGIINISGLYASTGDVVSDLLISEGDLVEKDQILAVFGSHEILKTDLKLAKAGVNVARARLEKVKAGPGKDLIRVHEAKIKVLKAELEAAEARCLREKKLKHRKQ